MFIEDGSYKNSSFRDSKRSLTINIGLNLHYTCNVFTSPISRSVDDDDERVKESSKQALRVMSCGCYFFDFSRSTGSCNVYLIASAYTPVTLVALLIYRLVKERRTLRNKETHVNASRMTNDEGENEVVLAIFMNIQIISTRLQFACIKNSA